MLQNQPTTERRSDCTKVTEIRSRSRRTMADGRDFRNSASRDLIPSESEIAGLRRSFSSHSLDPWCWDQVLLQHAQGSQQVRVGPQQCEDVAVRPEQHALCLVKRKPLADLAARLHHNDHSGGRNTLLELWHAFSQKGRMTEETEPATPRDLVQASAVIESRLRKYLARWHPAADPDARSELRLREVEHARLLTSKARIALARDLRVCRLDYATKIDGKLDEGTHVGTALALVGVEQTIPRTPAENRLELPSEVDAVPDARAHALSEEGWRLVAGISRQQQTSLAPTLGYDRVERVNRRALEGCILRGDPA